MYANKSLLWRFVFMVVFLLLCIMFYLSYAFIWRNSQHLNIALFRVKPRAQTVTLSQKEIFKTVLKIRERNCLTMEKYKRHTDGQLDCRILAECNKFRDDKGTRPPDCDQRLPNAIIIGTYKSGTRELIDFLAMHPGIVIKRKPFYEISFFSTKRWLKGFQWYRTRMPYSLDWQMTMEKSPSYFVSKHTPRRLTLMNPNVKLILIVRDPVDRVISQWTFRGVINITLSKVKDKIRILEERLKRDKGSHKIALMNSMYDLSYQNYLKRFNRSQIHIVDSEKLKSNPFSVLYSIESFLGLTHYIKQDDFIYNHDKKFYCLRVPGTKNGSSCYGNNRGRPNPDIPDLEAIKSELRQLFDPHNKRFYNLCGTNFHWQ